MLIFTRLFNPTESSDLLKWTVAWQVPSPLRNRSGRPSQLISVSITYNLFIMQVSYFFFFFKRPNLALSLRVSLFPSRDFWQTGAIFRSDRVLNDSSCPCHIIKIRLLQFPAGCPEWGPLCGLQLAQGPLKGGIWSKHPLPGSHCVPCHSDKIYPDSINGHLFSPGWISHY